VRASVRDLPSARSAGSGGTIANTATVGSDAPDPDLSNIAKTITTTVAK
jgi:hypothetical protein